MRRKLEFNLDIAMENYLMLKCNQGEDILLSANLFDNATELDLSKITIANIDLKYVNANGTITDIPNAAFKTDKSNSNIENILNIELPANCTKSQGIARFQVELKNNGILYTFPLELIVIENVFMGKSASNNQIIIMDQLNQLKQDLDAQKLTIQQFLTQVQNLIDNELKDAKADVSALTTEVDNLINTQLADATKEINALVKKIADAVATIPQEALDLQKGIDKNKVDILTSLQQAKDTNNIIANGDFLLKDKYWNINIGSNITFEADNTAKMVGGNYIQQLANTIKYRLYKNKTYKISISYVTSADYVVGSNCRLRVGKGAASTLVDYGVNVSKVSTVLTNDSRIVTVQEDNIYDFALMSQSATGWIKYKELKVEDITLENEIEDLQEANKHYSIKATTANQVNKYTKLMTYKLPKQYSTFNNKIRIVTNAIEKDTVRYVEFTVKVRNENTLGMMATGNIVISECIGFNADDLILVNTSGATGQGAWFELHLKHSIPNSIRIYYTILDESAYEEGSVTYEENKDYTLDLPPQNPTTRVFGKFTNGALAESFTTDAHYSIIAEKVANNVQAQNTIISKIPLASSFKPGNMSSVDKTKLDGLDFSQQNTNGIGYKRLSYNTVLLFGFVETDIDPKGEVKIDITYPMEIFGQYYLSASVTHNNTSNGNDWCSSINTSLIRKERGSGTVIAKDVSGMDKKYNFKIQWLIVGEVV